MAARIGFWDSTPGFARYLMGSVFRERRLSKDLTVEQVAKALLCSATKISRLETGTRIATPRDVGDLASLYQLNSEERTFLLDLIHVCRQAVADKPDWHEDREFSIYVKSI